MIPVELYNDCVIQVEYHELETFNGDSSSISVVEPQFSMENLQVMMMMMTMMMMMLYHDDDDDDDDDALS